MSRDSSLSVSDVPALCDVTNQPRKRGFALISCRTSSGDYNNEQVYGKNNHLPGKRVALGVENHPVSRPSVVGKENDCSYVPPKIQVCSGVENPGAGTDTGAKGAKRARAVGLLPLKGGKSYKLQSHVKSDSYTEDARIGIPNATLGTTKQSMFVEGISNLRRGEVSVKCQGDEERDLSGIAKCSSTKEGSTEGARVPVFECNQSFELTRCTLLKNDGGSSSESDFDTLRECSCSFCTKAAYIWSDLHYQDVKGRISASAKSRREAINLSKKIGLSGKDTKLEVDLLNQWKSLFRSMEDIFVQECGQLESSFRTLKNVSENRKMNIEMTHGVLMEIQPCSSDASDCIGR